MANIEMNFKFPLKILRTINYYVIMYFNILLLRDLNSMISFFVTYLLFYKFNYVSTRFICLLFYHVCQLNIFNLIVIKKYQNNKL